MLTKRLSDVCEDAEKLKQLRLNLNRMHQLVDKDRQSACSLFDDNISNILITLEHATKYVDDLYLIYKSKIDEIEVQF